MEGNDDKLYCPRCGSSQLTANKKGFGAGKALTGAILTGGIGLLAGFIGSGDVKVTCLECGSTWRAGELKTTPPPKRTKEQEESETLGGCAVALALLLVGVIIALIVA